MKMLLRYAAAAWLAAGLTHASVLTGVSPFGGLGTVSGTISGNNVTITENITGFLTNNPFGVILNVTTPPDTASTYHITKQITNSTGSTWTSYQVGFGCDGTGPNGRGTVDCYSSGLSSQLSASSGITSSAGSILQPNNVYFQVGGISIAPGQTLTLNFNWDTCPRCSGGVPMFEYANLASPEPGAFMLTGAGLLLPLYLRRRKRA